MHLGFLSPPRPPLYLPNLSFLSLLFRFFRFLKKPFAFSKTTCFIKNRLLFRNRQLLPKPAAFLVCLPIFHYVRFRRICPCKPLRPCRYRQL